MDRDRFDALTRLLATSGSRRVTLGALLGVLAGPAAAEAAKKRRPDRGKDKGGNRDRDRSGDHSRDQALPAERRGKNRKRRKHKKKRGGRGNGGQPEPQPEACCGTAQCAPPEPGSTRSDCDYAGRFFAAHDFNGSIFRGIDGRGIDFTAADLHGSVFAEACLQGASFRSARLDGSTWGDACLFDADFTGADVDDDDPLFDEALFCNTTMPDGAVNDRDCGRATACCRRQAEPGPAECAGDCAEDSDCASAPNCVCNRVQGECCRPDCAGKVCGSDGCGGSCGTCGNDELCQDGQCTFCAPTCPCQGQSICIEEGSNVLCGGGHPTPCTCMVSRTGEPICVGAFQIPPSNCQTDSDCRSYASGAVCVAAAPAGSDCPTEGNFCAAPCCNAQSCANGCCDGGLCQPGNSFEACGTGGGVCATCGLNQTCQNGQCTG